MSGSKHSSVGVRVLKNETSAVLRRVRAGESLIVTDRDEPVAMLVPLGEADAARGLAALVASGVVSWEGGKPRGSRRPGAVRGRTVSSAVVEDRR